MDNTFASPYLQRPIELGADLVVHSTTKYLAGALRRLRRGVAGPLDSSSRSLLPECRRGRAWPIRFVAGLAGHQNLGGAHGAPLRKCSAACYLAGGAKTSASVYYPGLSSHPNHDVARRQMRDFGGMISVRLNGGGAAAQRLLTAHTLVQPGRKLGRRRSLIGHPATMTHASIPADVRAIARRRRRPGPSERGHRGC